MSTSAIESKPETYWQKLLPQNSTHQIAQAKATLEQNKANLQQTQASRELADVTNARDSKLVTQGWLTRQQGDNDRLTLQAQQAAVGVAESNIAAQEAQIRDPRSDSARQASA
jgi:multidrug resistance efflux pump